MVIRTLSFPKCLHLQVPPAYSEYATHTQKIVALHFDGICEVADKVFDSSVTHLPLSSLPRFFFLPKGAIGQVYRC